MSEYGNINRAFAGMKAEHYQFAEVLKSARAVDEIDFGNPVFRYEGVDDAVYNYYLDVGKIVFDGDFGAGDVITITINGEDAADVTYATSHDATAAAVVAAIKAVEIEDNNGNTINPDCILDPDDTNNRTFLIRTLGVDATVAEAVAGGNEPTGTITYFSDQVFAGMARHKAKYIENGDTTAKYEIQDTVSIVEKGFYWGVINNETVLENQACYIDNSGSNKGVFATSGDDIGCFFRSENYTQPSLSDYLAIIELRGLKKLNTAYTWA